MVLITQDVRIVGDFMCVFLFSKHIFIERVILDLTKKLFKLL